MASTQVSTPVKSGNVVADIVSWSTNLPLWQQDGLRRIVEKSTLAADDLADLAELCKKEYGLSDTVLEARPLPPEAIPQGPATTQAVTLRTISNTTHVNALDSTQTLTFAEQGLTIIFGYNGSGKSGYGRILRRACRAREKGPAILPNVLDGAPVEPASASITYALDGVEQPPAPWIDEKSAVHALAAVSFFDSHCATTYVGGKHDIAFTPLGLDLVPKLAAACKDVQTQLDKERKAVADVRPLFLQSAIASGETAVGKFLKALTHEASIERLEQLASLTDADRQRQQQLLSLLAHDARKQVLEIRDRIRRLDSLKDDMARATEALSPPSIDALKALAGDYHTKKLAAEAAAHARFASDPLPGIGEAAWQELWEAARRYSALAYPNQPYPAVDDENSVCVLCQQPLGGDARDRLTRFEQFVADDTATSAAKAKAALSEAVQQLDLLGLRNAVLREELKDLQLVDENTAKDARNTLAALIRQWRLISRAHQRGNWTLAGTAPVYHLAPKLKPIIAALSDRAAELERTADYAQRKTLESELAELKAREWLGTVLGDVKEHITRLDELHKFSTCIDNAKTHSHTAKSKSLAKAHVTDRLRDAFASELQHVLSGIRRFNVELNAVAGEFGSSYYRIQLVGASKAKIDLVVSEGEHRCIALAGFLAELATEPSPSAIIFDDPVTSLDHLWRECFAKRLTTEAARRQVIVFTHDIAFLHELMDLAKRNNTANTICWVYAQQSSCGHISDNLPWIGKGTLERIDALEKDTRTAKLYFDAHDDEKYEAAIASIYGKLRATVEKAVEECFFDGIVVRHREYIPLRQLHLITVITLPLCERMQKLFGRCSNVTEAHDRASLRSFGVPPPATALAEIAQLRAIVDEVRKLQHPHRK
jgi:hypothetical protein